MLPLEITSSVAVCSGTAITILLLELANKIKSFIRFGAIYYAAFSVGQLVIPPLVYELLFPGGLSSGGFSILITVAYSFSMLFYFYITLLIVLAFKIAKAIKFCLSLVVGYVLTLLTVYS